MAQSGSQQRPRDKYDDAADNLVSVAEWTDTGNAARIAQANAGKLMRVSDMKKWGSSEIWVGEASGGQDHS